MVEAARAGGAVALEHYRRELAVSLKPDRSPVTEADREAERTIAAPVSARYIRYHATPKRILCASELQALDRVDAEPFDLRIALRTIVVLMKTRMSSTEATADAEQVRGKDIELNRARPS